jgi:hypothetical protein
LTGRKILMASAQSNLKDVTLELGGKGPTIVFEDVDIDQAVKWAANGILYVPTHPSSVFRGLIRQFLDEATIWVIHHPSMIYAYHSPYSTSRSILYSRFPYLSSRNHIRRILVQVYRGCKTCHLHDRGSVRSRNRRWSSSIS